MPRYTEQQARAAIAESICYADALRKLGLRPAGGNHRIFRRYVDQIWMIPTDHFDADRARVCKLQTRRAVELADVLTTSSSYSRHALKARLYSEGLKQPVCELCGQTEVWRGLQMSLVLDHINGVPDDNRLENLRIVCPNCNATLDTHCGRKNRLEDRACLHCGALFHPHNPRQKYCGRVCGQRYGKRQRGPRLDRRKVRRPSYAQLQLDVQSMPMTDVGHKYGVSDTAVRKWLRAYQMQPGV